MTDIYLDVWNKAANANFATPDEPYGASASAAAAVLRKYLVPRVEGPFDDLIEKLHSVARDLDATHVKIPDPCIVAELRALCERVGYGNVMVSTSALWRDRLGKLAGGEFVAGPCRSTVKVDIEVIGQAVAALATLQAENAALKAELEKAVEPEWFYHPDYTETCRYSPHEVIDMYYDPEPGKYVFEIEAACSLPSIWCTVHCLTEDE